MTISQNRPEMILGSGAAFGEVREDAPQRGNTLLLLGLFVLAVMPAIFAFRLIHDYGVNVPYWDQWNMVSASLEAHNGGIPPSLFAQHNEHRIVVPRIIFITLDNLTHWNQFAQMYTTFVIVCLTSLGVYVLSRTTIRQGPYREEKVMGIWFVCNLLIFSPLQWENWLWGVGMVNVLPMAFIIWAIIVVRSRMYTWLKMAIALVMATAATFSVGDGILAWPLIGLLWVWSPMLAARQKKKIPLLVVWCAGFGINVGMYFHNYVKPGHSVVAYSVNKGAIIGYIVAFMGGPLCMGTTIPPVTMATIVGSILLVVLGIAGCIFLWVWRKERDVETSWNMLAWFAVAGFTVGAGVMAGPTRAGFGTAQALASRYVTFALYLCVALVNLSVVIMGQRRLQQRKMWSHVAIALITGIVVMHLLEVYPSYLAAQQIYKDRTQAKAALLLVRSLPDDDPNLALLFPITSQLKIGAETTNSIGFMQPPLIASNHAREILVPANSKYKWQEEGRIDQAYMADPDHLVASGWGVFINQRRPIDAVFLTWDRFDGDPIIFGLGNMGTSRMDVANLLQAPACEASGWTANLPASRLPPGKDPLRIQAWALNVRTGKAQPLGGAITVNR